MRAKELIEVGYVARAHGVRGEVRVVAHDPGSAPLLDADSVVVGGERFTVARARPVPGAFLMALAEVGDRNRAEALRGRTVEVDRDLVPLDEGEVILADLVGCRVELTDGTPWGRVTAIDVGPQDRLVIVDGDRERLLPYVPAFVLDVDLEAGCITVEPPPGLPDAPARRT